MSNRLKEIQERPFWKWLSPSQKESMGTLVSEYRFSHEEARIFATITVDYEMWGKGEHASTDLFMSLSANLPGNFKQVKKRALSELKKKWEEEKGQKGYEKPLAYTAPKKPTHLKQDSGDKIYGDCPVASDKTVCCNLKTIDVVQNCGLDCSYCCIQSFYTDNKVYFEEDIVSKLKKLEETLDPNKNYHFGTGQSSDSLMWGNKENNLSHLVEFARRNPNVVVEFKTKTSNIVPLIELNPPKNVICSWSMNTDRVIENEEHLSSSLSERIRAARKYADTGRLVVFHFHPIVQYENYLFEYQTLFERIQSSFSPEEVAFVSFGTLTFIKPVMQKIRARKMPSKILQMPMVDACGKWSYPDEIKNEMFTAAYKSFEKWHDQVFFYLCMEEKKYWDMMLRAPLEEGYDLEDMLNTATLSKVNLLKN